MLTALTLPMGMLLETQLSWQHFPVLSFNESLARSLYNLLYNFTILSPKVSAQIVSSQPPSQLPILVFCSLRLKEMATDFIA